MSVQYQEWFSVILDSEMFRFRFSTCCYVCL